MMTRIILVLLLSTAALALFDEGSAVFKLTQSNFKKSVLDSDEFWLVEFYAPWCGHCKHSAPEYEQAASILRGIVNVGAVDMTTDGKAGERYGVQGYPTIKLFGVDKSKPIDYSSSERTFSKFVEFSMNQVKKEIANRKKVLEKQKAQDEL